MSENEGVFDSVSWVSTSNSTCPDPNSAALSLNPGDPVTFVQVQDGNGALPDGLAQLDRHIAGIAGLCLAHGVRELWTHDRDFGRFSGLGVSPLV